MKSAATFQLPGTCQVKSTSLQAIFILVSILLQVLMVVGIFTLSGQVLALNKKPVPSLIQMLDGKVVRGAPVDSYHRDPKVIWDFVQNWSLLTFNWSGKLPDGQRDDGKTFVEKDNRRVPTPAWAASFALTSDFQVEFLEQLASIVPNDIYSGQTRTVLQFEPPVPEPKEIDKGNWEVDYVANLYVINNDAPIRKPIPVNKRIFVKVAPQVPFALEENTDVLARLLYRMRDSGLVIYDIKDLEL
jgi:hypothetical protein